MVSLSLLWLLLWLLCRIAIEQQAPLVPVLALQLHHHLLFISQLTLSLLMLMLSLLQLLCLLCRIAIEQQASLVPVLALQLHH
jgi:hypothetical protein